MHFLTNTAGTSAFISVKRAVCCSLLRIWARNRNRRRWLHTRKQIKFRFAFTLWHMCAYLPLERLNWLTACAWSCLVGSNYALSYRSAPHHGYGHLRRLLRPLGHRRGHQPLGQEHRSSTAVGIQYEFPYFSTELFSRLFPCTPRRLATR